MKVAVIVFPGSNCDRDAQAALQEVGVEAHLVWHGTATLTGFDAAVLPGGFSYGDYLRSGALGARSPMMEAVRAMAAAGRPVLGICNGFQILCESGILPGALTQNASRRFHCGWTDLRVASLPNTWGMDGGTRLRLPIAHGEGAYRVGEGGASALETTHRVVLQYCGPDGAVLPQYAVNGSDQNIAGVANRAGHVVGLMPHPERAMDPGLGGGDGRRFLKAWLNSGVAS